MLFVGLYDVTANNHLLEDEVGLMEIEDEIQLADITEVLVEHLDEVMNDVEHNQFVVFLFYACDKVQRSIALEHNLVVAPLQEMSQLAAATNDHCANLFYREKTLVHVIYWVVRVHLNAVDLPRAKYSNAPSA